MTEEARVSGFGVIPELNPDASAEVSGLGIVPELIPTGSVEVSGLGIVPELIPTGSVEVSGLGIVPELDPITGIQVFGVGCVLEYYRELNMAFTAVPGFFKLKKNFAVIKDKNGTVLGQIKNFTVEQTVTTENVTRISDTIAYAVRTGKKSLFNLTVYLQNSMKEFALVMGAEELPGTGWVGTETIKLTPSSQPTDLMIEAYNNTSDVARLQGTWVVDNFEPISNIIDVSGQRGGALYTTVNGVCDDIYFVPEPYTGV